MKNKEQTRSLLIAVMTLILVSMSACSNTTPTNVPSTPSVSSLGPGLHVFGNQIMMSNGKALVYHGVNRSGSEYHCTQKGKSTFDGPSDQASITAMLTWKITIVRVPLNEDCWLGINGEPANGTTGAQYQQDIVNYVKLLRQNNLAVIVELHWNAPGSQQALGQLPMPDADHAPTFWTSVAGTFKADPFIIFDLYNEPYAMNWQCWLGGSTRAGAKPCASMGFAAAGMQTLVNAVRATGAGNLILLGGLAYANDFYGWIQFKPHDPKNNLAASFHMYANNGCNTTSCLDSEVAPVKAQYPVLVGEIGEFDCASTFINSMMPWFDSHHIGYLAWAWDTYDCSTFPSLISDYKGTATGYGIGFKNHLSSI